jgi:diguanylate cyclase (GGDEF)-like protein/PAS domain S-box-containing protein
MSAWRAAPGADPRDVSATLDPGWASARQVWGVVGTDDTAGVVQWLSPSVEAVLGYRPDELVGTSLLDLVHPEARDRVDDACQSLQARGNASPPVAVRARHRDGTWRPLEVVFTNQVAPPAVAGVVVSARDVTDRTEAQASSPALFREVADSAPVMIWMTDADDRVVFFNRRWHEFTGRTETEELGHGWEAGLHPEDRDRVIRSFHHREPYEVDYRVRVADGSYRRVVDVGVPRYDAAGQLAGHVGTVIDVTGLVQAEEAQRLSESRFRALVQNSHDLVSIYDNEGRFVFASPSHERVLGYDPAERVGTAAVDLLHPDELDDVTRVFAEQLLVTGIPAPIEHRVRHRDGSWRWLESVAMLLTDEPAIGGVLVNARDITDRRRAEFIAAEQSRILEAIARGAPLQSSLDAIARLVDTWIPDGLAVLTIVEPDTLLLQVAAAPDVPPPVVAALDGIAVEAEDAGIPDAVARLDIRAAGPGETATTLVEHGFRSWWGKPIVDAAGGGRKHLGAVIVLRRDAIDPDPSDQRLLDAAGSLTAIAVERDRSEARLSHQAMHDTLTGLPNREQALDRLRRIGRHERQGGPDVAVLFLDLDRFKVLNDSLGHEAGDRLLVEMGRRLDEVLRPGDLVARFGGDEFVIVCEQLDGVEAAHALAERLLRIAREPFVLDGFETVVTASIGIAVADGRPPEALLRDADAAMYRAKEKGRDRAELFDVQLREDVVGRLDTERELRHALEHGGLLLYYQPIVSLQTGAVTGVQSLLRWNHPTRGLLTPADFVGVAEESGLMRPIGEWIRDEVCRTAARWHQEHPEWGRLVTSVNVSAAELSDPHLATNIAKTVLDSDLEPALLSFEITERLLFQDVEAARALFNELHELGVQLALADFGTGYSPLVHLKQFPIDSVKIDQVFVAGLGSDPFDDAIVDAVVDLSNQLDLVSVAEGVETAAQEERLRAIGCRCAQGQRLGPPMPVPLVEAWLSRRPPR